MAWFLVYVAIGAILLCELSQQQEFSVPDSMIELLYPVGFSVSIPGKCCKVPSFPNLDADDLLNNFCVASVAIVLYIREQKLVRVKATCYLTYYVAIRQDREGIRLVAFHGRLNEVIDTYDDGGSYSKDLTSAKNGKWTYTDKSTRFKIGDVINYWMYVEYRSAGSNLGYRSEFRQFNVTECPRRMMDDVGMCTAPDPLQFTFPHATVEILQPKGFSVSIPDQQGITLFAFHGNINEPFEGRESGYFASDITSAENGRWTFIDRNTQLGPGDTIFYWLYVNHKDHRGSIKGYVKEHQRYDVSGIKECLKSPTVWNGETSCGGQLLFEEQFSSADMSNWIREIHYADEPDYEFVIYDRYDDNLYVKNGELHVKPTLVDEKFGENFISSPNGYDLGPKCTADVPRNCNRKSIAGYILPPVLSGRITSKHSFKYARVDIKAKMPKGDWIYPQLFLSPKSYEYGKENYESGEIRVAFAAGNPELNGELQGKILLGTSATARAFGIAKLIKSDEGWSDNYHLYSVIWKPDSLTFLVDNMEYGQIIASKRFSDVFHTENANPAAKWRRGSPLAPFDKEMVIKLGVGVGGHSFPDNITNKPYTNVEAKSELKFYRAKKAWMPTWNEDNELIIAYIKVYAL